MIRFRDSAASRCRRSRFMKVKTLSIFVLLLCGCLLFTGCMGSAAPKGWSGPVADNGTVYVGSMTGTVVSFYNIDVEKKGGGGRMQWIYPDGTTISYVYGDPVVDNGSVYITCYNGKVYVVNASHGYSDWKYPAEATKYVGVIVGSPVVANGILYFGSSDKKLYAIDTATGELALAWQQPFETGDKIWSTPVVDNGTVYVGSFDKKLYALDAADGTKKWEFKAGGAIVSTPLVYNGTLYFGSLDRKIYAVNADTGKLLDGFKPFEAGNWFWSKAVAYNGSIIDCSLDGSVYAIDAVTGAELWSVKLNGSIRGNPALVNNSLVIGTDEGNNKGNVYCINTDTHQQIWQYLNSDQSMNAIYASIGADDTTVFVHTNKMIYAITLADGKPLWSTSTGGGE